MSRKSKNTTLLNKPTPTSLFAQAINCADEDASRLLVEQALNVLHADEPKNNKDLDVVLSLIRGIGPKDTVEAMLTAQFVALHLRGMTTMAKNYINATGHGMMILRLSHHSLDLLQRYRERYRDAVPVVPTMNSILSSQVPQFPQDKMEQTP